MVPRDQFEKMAVLALVAILLVGILSIKAFALDDENDGFEESIIYQDSGIPPIDSFREDVSAIRQDLDILLYFVIPASAAVLFVYLLCKWFCRTFVDSVL